MYQKNLKKSKKKPLLLHEKGLDLDITNKEEHNMQNLSKYLIVLALLTTINGYVATRFMKANKETYHGHYEFLAGQNQALSDIGSQNFTSTEVKVDVTMYQPNADTVR